MADQSPPGSGNTRPSIGSPRKRGGGRRALSGQVMSNRGRSLCRIAHIKGRDRASAKRKHLRPDHFVGVSQRYDAIMGTIRKAKVNCIALQNTARRKEQSDEMEIGGCALAPRQSGSAQGVSEGMQRGAESREYFAGQLRVCRGRSWRRWAV